MPASRAHRAPADTGPDPWTDPRTFRPLSTSQLIVDPRNQRECSAEQAARIAHEWDWARYEVPTVVESSTIKGCYDVVEGQHRVMAAHIVANKISRDLSIMCAILPNTTTDPEQSELALGIAKGRRQHTAYEQWRLAVLAGHPHEVKATEVLKSMELRVGQGQSASTISAVATVRRIVHGGGFSPEYGAQTLRSTLEALTAAFPTWDANSNSTRWDRNLMLAVANIIIHNEGIDLKRFAESIAVRPAVQWVNLGRGSEQLPPDVAIRQQIAKQYNHNLRRGKIDQGEAQ